MFCQYRHVLRKEGLPSDNRILGRFCHAGNILKCTYTNMDSVINLDGNGDVVSVNGAAAGTCRRRASLTPGRRVQRTQSMNHSHSVSLPDTAELYHGVYQQASSYQHHHKYVSQTILQWLSGRLSSLAMLGYHLWTLASGALKCCDAVHDR